jgi:hypothetical protein
MVMIVTYLARLMLLIPEISTADASHLQELADFQSAQSETHLRDIGAFVNADGFNSKPVEPPLSDQFSNQAQQQKRPETKIRKKQKISKQQLRGRDNAPCVQVNETMRKFLTQVKLFCGFDVMF